MTFSYVYAVVYFTYINPSLSLLSTSSLPGTYPLCSYIIYHMSSCSQSSCHPLVTSSVLQSFSLRNKVCFFVTQIPFICHVLRRQFLMCSYMKCLPNSNPHVSSILPLDSISGSHFFFLTLYFIFVRCKSWIIQFVDFSDCLISLSVYIWASSLSLHS